MDSSLHHEQSEWSMRPKSEDNKYITPEIDLIAIWGFIRIITNGIIQSSIFYMFVILLTLSDLMFVGLNLISQSRTNENVIPPTFSPTCPPIFSHHPFIYCICKLTLWLGGDAPEWMREWSQWDGIMPDGRWPPIDRNLALDRVSRSPCPALNVLANHGIINRSGEDLSFHRIAANISRTYNLSPTLAIQLLSAAWPLFRERKLISLEALTTHGLIEHDASLLRPDLHQSSIKSQTKPDQELIARYFSVPKLNMNQAEEIKKQKIKNKMILSDYNYNNPNQRKNNNGDEDQQEKLKYEEEIKLTHLQFSNFLKQRRNESKNQNPSFVQNFFYKFFASGNCALLIELFNGNLYDIRAFIGAGISLQRHARHQHMGAQSEMSNFNLDKSQLDLINVEVLPYDSWRPHNLHPWGLTIFKSVYSTFKIEART